MKIDNLKKLFIHELKDLYNAEKQITKALPKMAKKAQSEELRAAFEEHLEETENQIERLEQVFQIMDMKASGSTCEAMKGIIEEANGLLKEDLDPEVIDAALIMAAQKVEHYEMAGYGTVRDYAEKLGLNDAADLLQETLDEEGAADKKLMDLARGGINDRALARAS